MSPQEVRAYLALLARDSVSDEWKDVLREKIADKLNVQQNEIKITITSDTEGDSSEEQEESQEEPQAAECIDLDAADAMFLEGEISYHEYKALVDEALKQKLHGEC